MCVSAVLLSQQLTQGPLPFHLLLLSLSEQSTLVRQGLDLVTEGEVLSEVRDDLGQLPWSLGCQCLWLQYPHSCRQRKGVQTHRHTDMEANKQTVRQTSK